MFPKCLLCLILCSEVCLSHVSRPQLGKDHSSDQVNNKTYTKDAEYKKWVARIMNGWPSRLGDVPYQISLKGLVHRLRAQYTSFCGATIITPRKLISAAHCFENTGWSCCSFPKPGRIEGTALRNIYAVAGNLFTTARYTSDGPNGQWRTLDSVTHPEKYKFPTLDIAVVVTDYPFNFNRFIGPIPMAVRNTDYMGTCLASGFGRTGHHKFDDSEILLLAHVVVHPNIYCSQLFGRPMDTYICTSVSFKSDVGMGDSGGPLVCANTGDPNEKFKTQGVLVGVVSGHLTSVGSFYSRVSGYQKFIASVDSASMIMYKYNTQSCIALAMSVLYKTFVLFRFV